MLFYVCQLQIPNLETRLIIKIDMASVYFYFILLKISKVVLSHGIHELHKNRNNLARIFYNVQFHNIIGHWQTLVTTKTVTTHHCIYMYRCRDV